MNKNKKIVSIIAGIALLLGAFYAGTVYEKSGSVASSTNGVGTNIQNRNGQYASGGRGGRMSGGGFLNGEIISKDANSVTIKLSDFGNSSNTSDSGSKIIFFDTNTAISKMDSGSLNDLTVGSQVSINGTANQDGSISAKSIQIRPMARQGVPTQQ